MIAVAPKSKEFREDVESAIQRAFPTITLQVVFTTRHAFNGGVNKCLATANQEFGHLPIQVLLWADLHWQDVQNAHGMHWWACANDHARATNSVSCGEKGQGGLHNHTPSQIERESPPCIPVKEKHANLFTVITLRDIRRTSIYWRHFSLRSWCHHGVVGSSFPTPCFCFSW